jgi:hypothetical protein
MVAVVAEVRMSLLGQEEVAAADQDPLRVEMESYLVKMVQLVWVEAQVVQVLQLQGVLLVVLV